MIDLAASNYIHTDICVVSIKSTQKRSFELEVVFKVDMVPYELQNSN
jgi:hypothetical protein